MKRVSVGLFFFVYTNISLAQAPLDNSTLHRPNITVDNCAMINTTECNRRNSQPNINRGIMVVSGINQISHDESVIVINQPPAIQTNSARNNVQRMMNRSECLANAQGNIETIRSCGK